MSASSCLPACSVPKAGIRFGANSQCKKLLADDQGQLTMGERETDRQERTGERGQDRRERTGERGEEWLCAESCVLRVKC